MFTRLNTLGYLAPTGIPAAIPLTFEEVVGTFTADLVSYWKFSASGADSIGTENAPFVGSPELNIPTIVDRDTIAEGALIDGKCIAWPGTPGDYAEALHDVAHKTASGTIVVYHQHDQLNEKSTLVCGDANATIGGFSVEITATGQSRAFIRDGLGTPVVLTGATGDVDTNLAYATVFKWGSPGMSLTLWGENGAMITRRTNTSTIGLAGTSVLRFGAWHSATPQTSTAHHDGPFARVLWLDRRMTDIEEQTLALSRTVDHGDNPPPPPVGTYLPFRGQLYGSVFYTQNHGNKRMRSGSINGVGTAPSQRGDGFYWECQKTGTITALYMHERIGDGYSIPIGAGNHGVYDLEIVPANRGTKLAVPGAPIRGRIFNYTVTTGIGVSSGADYPYRVLTTPADVTVGEPLFIRYMRKSGGYFSMNINWPFSFFDTTLPIDDYIEPAMGTGAGESITVASGHQIAIGRLADSVEPENVGSVPTRVRRWTPYVVGGIRQFDGPIFTEDGVIAGRISQGAPEWTFEYSDGDHVSFGVWGADRALTTWRLRCAGATRMRIRFRVTRATRTVSGVYVLGSRSTASGGTFRVRLESGPTTDAAYPDTNGTLIEEADCPANLFLNAGESPVISQVNSATGAKRDCSMLHFVWIPFDTNQTLTLGSHYTLVMYCVSGGSVDIQTWLRANAPGSAPVGNSSSPPINITPESSTMTWTQWETQRNVSGEAWEDSKEGAEKSLDGGATWTAMSGRGIPVAFKCE